MSEMVENKGYGYYGILTRYGTDIEATYTQDWEEAKSYWEYENARIHWFETKFECDKWLASDYWEMMIALEQDRNMHNWNEFINGNIDYNEMHTMNSDIV